MYQPGHKSNTDSRARKVVVKPQLVYRYWPRGRNIINYSFVSADGKKTSVCVTGKHFKLNVARKKDCVFVTSQRKTVDILL